MLHTFFQKSVGVFFNRATINHDTGNAMIGLFLLDSLYLTLCGKEES